MKNFYANKNDNNVYKKLRTIKNISQIELSQILNITQSAISKWESGIAIPDPIMLKKIADFYNVSIDYLLGKTPCPIDMRTLKFNDNVELYDIMKNTSYEKVPILGAIAAGTPAQAIESNDIDDYVYVDTKEYDNEIVFGLIIKGTSMEPRICEGDIAIVKVVDWVNTGTVAAVRVNGDSTTLKQVKFEQDGMWLIGFNPDFRPIYYTAKECSKLPVTVIGKLVQVIQKY